MKLLSFLKVVSVLTALVLPWVGYGQIVSSGLTGTVREQGGKAVAGATVTAVHVPTNTTYTAVTAENGRFTFSGLRPGGPYTVSGTATGYAIQSLTNVETALSGDADVTLSATPTSVVVMERFVTTVDRSALDSNATGAGSVLGVRQIENQPTSTRAFADMMKSNPFVSIRNYPQVTALGMNNRYNSITLDGARLNDSFGLSGSGLFSLRNPFSLDAVEQFSIALTPYDVTQSGFAGAAVNVVSKSGTNEFHGSAYYIYTSSKWQGADVFGTTAGTRPPTFYERTYGGTLGGPILKDRLFFFVNYEKFSNPSGGIATPRFTPDASLVSSLNTQLSALPGSPKFGQFGGANANLLEDEKKLAKLDWNITRDHRLTVRYSETVGSQPFFPEFNVASAPSAFPTLSPAPSFANGVTTLDSKYYDLAVSEEVWAGQLFSNWTSNLKTEFSYSKNDSTSLRSTPVILPEIVLLGAPGISTANGAPVSTNTALLLGTDYSSMGNGIITATVGYSGNATYNWKEFTFKAGFDHEESDFENLFRNGSYGRFVYSYTPTLNLATATPLAFVRNVSTAGFPGTDISKFEQTGYFLQAKWDPTYRFNATFGLRYDVLGSPIDPPFNPAFAAAFGVRNDATIDGADQIAPRLSFNYAVDEERRIQVRGGAGVFLGRNPWVWMSNSYGNAGFGRFTRTFTTGTLPTLAQYLGRTFPNTDPVFAFDPANPLGTTTATTGGGDVAFIKPGLKLPTNLRGNIAVDLRLPFLDSKLTVEYIRTDVQEAIFYEQINLVSAGRGADGRTYFRRFVSATDTSLVPLGTAGGLVNTASTAFARVFRFGNTDVGGSDYVAFSLDRPFRNGWAYNVTYTRGRATEAQPGGSSTASSQWAFNVVFNQNQVEESRSDFEVRDRLQASFSKEFNFFKRYKTAATLSYEGRTGLRYSYVYSGDLNFDGSSQNDAVAVPTGVGDSRFDFSGMTAAQRDAYLAFATAGELSAYAGSYAPRNAFIGPWQNRLDLHISQEVKVAGPVRVEIFADFINFGNWLSKDVFNYVETLGAPNNSNQLRVLGNATYGPDGRLRPTVALNPDGSINFPTASQFLPNNGDSRWRVQGGVRVKF